MLGDFGLAIAMPSTAAADNSSSSDVISSPRCSSSRLTAGGDSSSASTSRHAPLLRSCASTSSLRTIPGASAGTAGDSSNSGSGKQQHGIKVAVIRRSSSCGAVGGFDCSVMPQLKQLQAGGTPAYTAPEVVQATFNNTPLEAAVGPQVRRNKDCLLSAMRFVCRMPKRGVLCCSLLLNMRQLCRMHVQLLHNDLRRGSSPELMQCICTVHRRVPCILAW